MKANSQQPSERGDAIPALNAAVEDLKVAEKASSIPPAKAVLGSVIVLLTLVRDSMANKPDRVELGLLCAKVCRALDRGTKGKRPDELNLSLSGAIDRLTSTMENIQRKLVKWGKRGVVSRWFHAEGDRKAITAWRFDLEKSLQVFNNEPITNPDATASAVRRNDTNNHIVASGVQNYVTHTASIVSDSRRNASKSPEDARGKNRMPYASAPGDSPPPLPGRMHRTASDIHNDLAKNNIILSDIHRAFVQDQGGSGNTHMSTQTNIPGESPPLPPRTFFGRNELIEKVVDLAEKFIPIALIGASGIGKTSVALAVLHHDRIKQRFGHHRRFIRCDQLPASSAHLLRRLSNVIGAGIENPEDLTPLRTFLSSEKMIIVLDNAESILDLQGPEAQKIYDVAKELCQFKNICICITSRISTTPPDCKRFDVPTLSVDAARNTFYQIYGSGDRSDLVNTILERLDFHPLSITLLATVGYQNKWGMGRLTREWDRRQTSVLQTQRNKSLAAAIELSLASPMFRGLGPDARALLEIVAFFPQGVDENNLEWLFPTTPNRTDVFDKFCILSLAYRSNGFVTMLAPLRDYLSPKDPMASRLLCTTKERYFTRLSVNIDPDKPDFGESRWITSEDTNVEHLLDVFTTIDTNSSDDDDDVWNACNNFMAHLSWHKTRLTTLKPKIEGLPDDHGCKPEGLLVLSQLFGSVGNRVEQKRLLVRALDLCREQGSDEQVALVLMALSEANRLIGCHKEGIQQAREALGIYERLGDKGGQADCLIKLAPLLDYDERFDAAEKATLRAINLLPEEGEQFRICQSHRVLGMIYQSKGEIERAIHHLEVVLEIATPSNWNDDLLWAHCYLAQIFLSEGRLEEAQTHTEWARSHAVNKEYHRGGAMEMQARIWHSQHRLEEAKSEALRAADIYDKFRAAEDAKRCKELLRVIEGELNAPVTSGQSDFNSQGTER